MSRDREHLLASVLRSHLSPEHRDEPANGGVAAARGGDAAMEDGVLACVEFLEAGARQRGGLVRPSTASTVEAGLGTEESFEFLEKHLSIVLNCVVED